MVAPIDDLDYDSDDELDPAAVPDDFFPDDASDLSSIAYEPEGPQGPMLPPPVEIGPDGLPIGFPVLVHSDAAIEPLAYEPFPLTRNNAVSPDAVY